MRIQESKIEEVRLSVDIVDLISEYVQLKKRGKNYIGLCPFHTEKTPSFTVSQDKQIFHCFGCHAGGNIFKFLMDIEKISFVEAVQQLAAQQGIDLEVTEDKANGYQSEQELLYDLNTAAARYFSDNLLHHEEGEAARKYFEQRKLKLQTLRAFGLGYSLPGWERFINFAVEKKLDLDKALELGLIGKSDDGRLYDKFSGRIIFPIFSPNGRVVAFAGRLLEEREGAAKYLNSPESSIYVKGRILYGLSHAKDEIRKLDKAILVEGYMDLISLFQSGIKNVVAVSGTSLTEEQVQLLSRYTKNVVLLFDADTAGIKASMRSIELLLKRDMEIKIVSLPQGEDPDSFVNKFGKEQFEELIKKADNFLEYQTSYYESQGMFDDPAKAAEAIRELVKPAALISDELKRGFLLRTIARKFNIREKLLEAELDKALAKVDKQIDSEQKIEERKHQTEKLAVAVDESSGFESTELNLEKEIIKLLFEASRPVIEFISAHISPEDFLFEAHSKIASIVYEAFHNQEDLIASSLISKIHDEKLEQYVAEITFDKYSISRNWENIRPGQQTEKILLKIAYDNVRKFKLFSIDKLIKENSKMLEEAHSEEERIQYMREIRNLQLDKQKIFAEIVFEE